MYKIWITLAFLLSITQTAKGEGIEDYDSAISEYKSIAAVGGWPKVTCRGSLKIGVSYPCVSALRKRLELTGDLATPVYIQDHSVYDNNINVAVKHFQERHTIEEDGIVGPQTRRAMNTSVSSRIAELKRAKREFSKVLKGAEKEVVINIPAFEAWTFVNGEFNFGMDVIVGKTDRRTARFSHYIRYADFRPYWNVPDSIFRRDKLPKILKYGPKYLVRNHFEVINRVGRIISPYNINWRFYKTHYFPYRLRQEPGEWNALGLVKYMFPNKYSIYMHDTPTKRLFKHYRRTFSSGCVRLSNPELMGSFLLDWDIAKVGNMMHNGGHVIRRLPGKVPVHLVYIRAWISAEGKVRFAPNIYKLR